MKKWIFIVLSMLLLLCFFCSYATANELKDSEDLEITGFILDRTFSPFGKSFYEDFSAQWSNLRGTEGLNLQVKETLYPRSGTVLEIELNSQVIYRTFFGRRKNNSNDELVRQAIARIGYYIINQKNQQSSPELLGNGY